MTLGTVARDVGRILQVVSLMAFGSMVVSVALGELYAAPSFALTGVVMLGSGTALAR